MHRSSYTVLIVATDRSRRHVGIRTFKNRATQLLGEVRERQVEYVVTRRGKPIAVVHPYRVDDARVDRRALASPVLESLRRNASRVAAAAKESSAARAVARQRR